jgi:hypothetical protein
MIHSKMGPIEITSVLYQLAATLCHTADGLPFDSLRSNGDVSMYLTLAAAVLPSIIRLSNNNEYQKFSTR